MGNTRSKDSTDRQLNLLKAHQNLQKKTFGGKTNAVTEQIQELENIKAQPPPQPPKMARRVVQSQPPLQLQLQPQPEPEPEPQPEPQPQPQKTTSTPIPAPISTQSAYTSTPSPIPTEDSNSEDLSSNQLQQLEILKEEYNKLNARVKKMDSGNALSEHVKGEHGRLDTRLDNMNMDLYSRINKNKGDISKNMINNMNNTVMDIDRDARIDLINVDLKNKYLTKKDYNKGIDRVIEDVNKNYESLNDLAKFKGAFENLRYTRDDCK